MPLVKDGVVHSGPARQQSQSQNDLYLVSNYEESKQLWKEHKPTLQGFDLAWNRKFNDKKNPYQEELTDIDIPIDPNTGEYESHPKMLHKKEDRRVLKNEAYSLVRTKAGWCIITYLISGSKLLYMGSTKPEPKQFVLGRITKMMQAQVL